MELNKAIEKVWSQHKETYLPDKIQERAYGFYENHNPKDVLVLGLNPFYEKNTKQSRSVKYNVEDMLKYVTAESHLYECYFNRIQKMLKNTEFSIDLNHQMAYADLFYYRTNERKETLDLLLKTKNGFLFLEDQLKITQQLIEEVIQPKVIIATHLEIASLLGISKTKKEIPCLNYVFEAVDETFSGYRVYEIKGFKNDANQQTNLLGTRVICNPHLFSSGNTFYLRAEEILKELLAVNKTKKVEVQKMYLKPAYDLFIEHPSLYRLQKTVVLKALDEEVILHLKIFRNLPLKDSAKRMFAELSKSDVLDEKALIKLTSSDYCKKQFNIEGALLEKVTIKSTNNKMPYFSLPNTTFVFQTDWEKGSYSLLEKWYVSKITSKKKQINFLST